jgi:hypothetical protein
VTLTLEIPPEVQRELAALLLKEAVAGAGPIVQRGRSPEQIREWIDSLAEFSDRIPAIPGETFSRDTIYSDHD